MTRDDWVRSYNDKSGSWPVLVGIYLVLIGSLVGSATMIL